MQCGLAGDTGEGCSFILFRSKMLAESCWLFCNACAACPSYYHSTVNSCEPDFRMQTSVYRLQSVKLLQQETAKISAVFTGHTALLVEASSSAAVCLNTQPRQQHCLQRRTLVRHSRCTFLWASGTSRQYNTRLQLQNICQRLGKQLSMHMLMAAWFEHDI